MTNFNLNILSVIEGTEKKKGANLVFPLPKTLFFFPRTFVAVYTGLVSLPNGVSVKAYVCIMIGLSGIWVCLHEQLLIGLISAEKNVWFASREKVEKLEGVDLW